MSDYSPGDKIIDSRDVESRIGDLTAMKEDNEWWTEDDQAELDALKSLRDEAREYCEWEHGATLILDDHFREYAKEWAFDIGALHGDYSWPHNHIDWDAAADELKDGYTAVDFDDYTYWVR